MNLKLNFERKIVSDIAVSAQEYLELITGKTYIYDLQNDEEFIDKVLKENDINNISDYPLSEAFQLYDEINDSIHFILVKLLNVDTGINYYRFYEIYIKDKN